MIDEGSKVFVSLVTKEHFKGIITSSNAPDSIVLSTIEYSNDGEDHPLGSVEITIPWHSIAYVRQYMGKL